jgi:membrane associated rhomboid family serine protease
MSWRDRPYAGEPLDQGWAPMRLSLRRPGTMVFWLIVANVAVFFIDILSRNVSPDFFSFTFGLSGAGIASGRIWQLVTYMFLHVNVMHLLLNMLGLYVCGTELEQALGRWRFLEYYAICGIMGGLGYLGLPFFDALAYHIPVHESFHYVYPLRGASGAIYGLLLAAIIFFPHIQVILFIIPVPIRVFGLILAGILLLNIIMPGRVENRGGEICHVIGALAGLGTFYYWGMLPKLRGRLPSGGEGPVFPSPRSGPGFLARRRKGAWARKQQKLAEEEAEVDRILAKVHDSGLASLTRKEKKILSDATRRHQQDDQRRL